jgi:enoyl-CoA hydratase
MHSLIADSGAPGAVTDPGPVLFHLADGVARLTINRPEKRNALSPEVVVRMARAWEEIAGDSSVRVVVLRGAGDRVFSSGGDLQRLIPLLTGARQPEDEWDEKVKADPRLLNQAMLRTSRFTVPVVAAVNGAALAGGTELALAADLRIASQHSTFGLPEVTRGIIPAMGGLARLSRQVPYTFAARIALVGEPISAAEAFAMGLVTKVVPAGELDAEVERVVERMAANAPVAMRKAKEALLRCAGSPLPAALRIESECGAEVLRTDDAREGPRAFVEKRAPRFAGR